MRNLPNYPIESIINVMESKNFRVFNGRNNSGKYFDYDLNIVGIRNSNTVSNNFDDKYVIFYKLENKWKIHYFSCTTDPGKEELITPQFKEAQKNGTLIIKHDEQYRGSYTLGYHGSGQWRHIALLQTGLIKGYRDNNRDDIIDFLPSSITSGYYGANHHAASLWQDTTLVGRWSAGCQVLNKINEYKQVVDIWTTASKIWGNRFTYTLLHEKDFS